MSWNRKVDEFMALQHRSDNSKLNKLAMELEQKDNHLRDVVNEKGIEIQELKVTYPYYFLDGAWR